jgi:hypothetical protein
LRPEYRRDQRNRSILRPSNSNWLKNWNIRTPSHGTGADGDATPAAIDFKVLAPDLPINNLAKRHGAVYGRLDLTYKTLRREYETACKHNYVSDHTLFIAELKAKNPGMEVASKQAAPGDKPAVISIDEQGTPAGIGRRQTAHCLLQEQESRSGTGTMFEDSAVMLKPTMPAPARSSSCRTRLAGVDGGVDGGGPAATANSADRHSARRRCSGIARLYGGVFHAAHAIGFIHSAGRAGNLLEAFEGRLTCCLPDPQATNILDIPGWRRSPAISEICRPDSRAQPELAADAR